MTGIFIGGLGCSPVRHVGGLFNCVFRTGEEKAKPWLEQPCLLVDHIHQLPTKSAMKEASGPLLYAFLWMDKLLHHLGTDESLLTKHQHRQQSQAHPFGISLALFSACLFWLALEPHPCNAAGAFQPLEPLFSVRFPRVAIWFSHLLGKAG